MSEELMKVYGMGLGVFMERIRLRLGKEGGNVAATSELAGKT